MSDNDVFLLSESTGLVKMVPSPYAKEDVLQSLLEAFPQLLSASISNRDSQLLLVRREASVPDSEESSGRWSVDHLFVDTEAVPILVEVKRSSDTRIRREMIGQMLDYAANAATFWSADSLSRDFEATCDQTGRQPEQVMSGFLCDVETAEAFWQRVATNLDAGRVRMVFVADRVPLEVQRVVEFLNDQMSPAEVLAVEVRQYLGVKEGVQTLVPRLLGQTAKARKRKGPDSSAAHIEWNEDSLLKAMTVQAGPEVAGLARELFDWARMHGLIVRFGRGPKVGGAYVELPVDDGVVRIAGISMRGRHSVALNALSEIEPFSDERALDNLIARYERIKGFTIPAHRRRQKPEFDLSLLLDADSKAGFFAAIEFHVEELCAGQTAASAAVRAS